MPAERVRSLTWKKMRSAVAGSACDDSREYVIGCVDDGCCALMPVAGAPFADDQNLGDALRFTDLAEAFKVAWKTGRSVFEIVHDDGTERIEEILLDPEEEDEE